MASPPQPSPEPLPMHPPPSPPQNPPQPTPDNSTTPSSPPPENPIPPSSPPAPDHAPPESPPNNHLPLPSPPFSPSRLAIVLRSPDKPSTTPDSNPNPNSYSNNAPSSAVTIGSLLATTTDLSVSKAAAGTGVGLGSSKGTLLAPNPWKFRKGEMKRFELGLRVSALVLCVTSLSIMAADTVPGWAGDSFIRYQEYRYLLSVNVVGFLYSAFQLSAEVHQMFTRRNFIGHPIGYCFSLAMDQILAYMLVSASSAATSQNYIWISRFGGDSFTKLINASVSMSFLAFFCVGFSSVISAHHLFSSIS